VPWPRAFAQFGWLEYAVESKPTMFNRLLKPPLAIPFIGAKKFIYA
jgi:hypothetical protein